MIKMYVSKCEECGCEISIKTDRCLNCGERISTVSTAWIKSLVRKVFFILFAVYMLLSAFKNFWK